MSNFYVKFSDFKEDNIRVSKVFKDAGFFERADQIASCATQLLFGNKADGGHDLVFGNFCKDRFCPLCQARRSARRASELLQIMDRLSGEFIFMTLTVVNVSGDELGSKIDQMTKVFSDFIKDPRIKRGVQGYIRNLEVTYNSHECTYHPHFHILINVSDTYFCDSDQYLSRNDVLEVWRRYMHDDRINQVDVRKVRGKRLDKAIVEVTKYFTKFGDWIYEANASSVLDCFINSLKSTNCTTMGGSIRKAVLQLRKEKLEDQLPYDEKIAAFIQNSNSVYTSVSYFSYYSHTINGGSSYLLENIVSSDIRNFILFIESHYFLLLRFQKALNIVYKQQYFNKFTLWGKVYNESRNERVCQE